MHSSVRLSFRIDSASNGALIFILYFWYQSSFLWSLEGHGAGFLEKKAKNGEKGVKNMHFRAFLGNQPLYFFDFWYETSLIYFFKFDTGSYARKNICGPKIPKTPNKLTGFYIRNNKLTLNLELCLFGKSTK